ncbi:MAG: MBOAT family protein, partial [Chlorobi bacterium]|nr:MBOAT family protein [Chlorobiota bacterium]
NRKGTVRSWVNILVTMVLGGLWHGASLRFLLWGTLHGTGLVVEKIFFRILPSVHHPRKTGQFVSRFFTFHFVTFLWIFFRAPDMATVRSMINSVVHNWDFSIIADIAEYYTGAITLLVTGYLLHWIPAQWQENSRGWFIRQPVGVKFILIFIIAAILVQAKNTGFRPFIYFRF